MKKIYLFLFVALAFVGCSKHDPILPGVRHDIFDSNDIVVENKEVPDLSGNVKNISGDEKCDYRQDSSNTVWDGDKKLFSGFSGDTFVKSSQSPICDGQYIYTGLSTGEVIKINKNNGKLIWMADVFRASNMMGGASVVDIVAHVGLDGKYVYAGGLGDAFCKLNAGNGHKIWCLEISVPTDFIIVDDFAFVVGGDNNLYAIDNKNGSVYWKTEIKKQKKPIFEGGIIRVGKEKINYKDGTLVK